MEYETKITVKPIFWDRAPNVLVMMNGKIVDDIKTFEKSNHSTVLSYKLNLKEHNRLQICLQNKTNDQTVQENGKIIKDQYLILEDLEIDKVVLQPAMLLKGTFQPLYPSNLQQQDLPKQLHTTQFNFNGIYSLDFTMPIHVWFFQHLD